MLGDSLSTPSQHGLQGSVSSRSSVVLAGGLVTDAPAAFSRVDAVGCGELTDVSSISNLSIAGLTQAAAAMVMQSPHPACSRVFDNSPVSVLAGPGVFTPSPSPSPSPIPTGNSIVEGRDAVANLDACLNDASSLDSEAGISRVEPPPATDGAISCTGPPPLPIRTRRKPPLSEESGVAGWRTRYWRREAERRCKSSSDSINRGEEEGEAEVEGKVEIFLDNALTVADSEPESPTTPCSTSKPQVLECPSTPLIKSKELSRQSSLNDTKLLLTTHLKRTASIFMFDKHFEFLREIGRGSFSTVYEARDRRVGSLCAVKMSKRQFRGREDRERYMHEIQSVACLAEHPNVIKYFRSWQQDSHFYIQMELCEAGNLRTLLDSLKEPLVENQVWTYIEQVAAGLEHIHSQGVLHLDIKPENIFVDSQGLLQFFQSNSLSFFIGLTGVLKIGDFGLAVPWKLWEWEEGDGGYVAPELLQEQEPGPEADMYSFGAMVYEWMTNSKLPRSGSAREGQIEVPSNRSITLGSLVRSLLNPNPSKRPSATRVLVWRQAA